MKITIMFRGREQSRPELGFRLLQRLGEDVQELGFVESSPKQDGRNMIMVLAPHKNAADLKKAAADAKNAQASTPSETGEISDVSDASDFSDASDISDISMDIQADDGIPSTGDEQ